ncbi:MAG TPA: methylmalonyl Co-A mutase-associated GTPase MeaB, partial [Desulfobacteraceae bacterium]|nr:methylmalonyl Co-A mutase-associated GTPase MeaB [Desulfobacteraceae bacterium]
LVINKADGDNLQKAKMAKKEYETAFHLLRPISASWQPPVLTCSALESTGLGEIWDIILKHREKLTKTGEFQLKRKDQSVSWMRSLLEEGLKNRFYQNKNIKKMLPQITKEVEKGMITPTSAAHKLLMAENCQT